MSWVDVRLSFMEETSILTHPQQHYIVMTLGNFRTDIV